MSAHVFISYSRKDRIIVGKFVEQLLSDDFIVWQDINDIKPGDTWQPVMFQAIDNSAIMLVFWSLNSSQSPYVRQEIEHAQSINKPITPVFLDDKPDPYNLRTIQGITSQQYTPMLGQVLVNRVPRIQRELLSLDLTKRMDAQPGVMEIEISHKKYLTIPFINSAYSKAEIIAKANTIVSKVSRIQLIVHCTGTVGNDVLESVFTRVQQLDDAYPDAKEPFFAIYVTGPRHPLDKNSYWIEDSNIAHFSDINRTVQKAIKQLDSSTRFFQLFQKVPLETAFLIGSYAYRNTRFELYKWDHPNKRYTYRIMDIPSH